VGVEKEKNGLISVDSPLKDQRCYLLLLLFQFFVKSIYIGFCYVATKLRTYLN